MNYVLPTEEISRWYKAESMFWFLLFFIMQICNENQVRQKENQSEQYVEVNAANKFSAAAKASAEAQCYLLVQLA